MQEVIKKGKICYKKAERNFIWNSITSAGHFWSSWWMSRPHSHWLAGLWCLTPLSTIFQLYLSWQSGILVEENRVTGENHRPVASHWQTLSQNVVSSTPRHEWDSNSTFSGDRHWLHSSCKSNYHMITTTTAPYSHWSCVLLKKKKTHADVITFLNVKLLCSTDIHDDILEK